MRYAISLFLLAACSSDPGAPPPVDAGSDARVQDEAASPTDAAPGDAAVLDAENYGCSNGVTPTTTHEPPGMAMQIDTGPLTTTPPATGTWTNGNATFQMDSPVTPTQYGESSANLVRVPCGSGLRILYNPSLSGGWSPVRFGAAIASPGKSTYYQRWRVRTVPNWAGPRNGNGVKMCEPQAIDQGGGGGTGTNDILMMWPNGAPNDQMSAMEGIQGPNDIFRDLGINQNAPGNLSDGAWHWDERIFVAESAPGAGDGQYLAYEDGVLVAKYTDVLWVAAGGTWGITGWLVDPTFGGAPESTHPLAGDYWDFDQLYVSTK
ncbi:MAG TPA: hypothetical protein VGH28_33820 [Polyangiaceae bacterium]|jgi:hypothetical protein